MNIPHLKSINKVNLTYPTGEEPLLVECDDLNNYVCKYRRSTASGYKLVGELVGSVFAKGWDIPTPDIAFVNVCHADRGKLERYLRNDCLDCCFGSRMNPQAIDVTKLLANQIKVSLANRKNFLKIGLFDLWLSNEDRNYNNANLIYDVGNEELVAIDHGCIFNTASYGDRLSILTENETILNSDLSRHLFDGTSVDESRILCSEIIHEAETSFFSKCEQEIESLINIIPEVWKVDLSDVLKSLEYLLSKEWRAKWFSTVLEYINLIYIANGKRT